MTYHVDVCKVLGLLVLEVLGFAWLVPAWLVFDHCIDVGLGHWLRVRQILLCKS